MASKFYFISFIAGLALGDYRLDGRLELVACATDGEIRGFLPTNPEVASKGSTLESGTHNKCLIKVHKSEVT